MSNELYVGDEVDFIEFGKYKSKGTVTEIKMLNTYDIRNRPCVCVYESWGNDHAPMTTCGHNFCFIRWDEGWKDFKADAELDLKYYEYLDMFFGINKDNKEK